MEVPSVAIGASGRGLSALLPSVAIRFRQPARDWREAIRYAGEALTASGAATAAYADEMIATVEEFGPYIVIAPGIALAHSRPSPAVLRTGLAWVTLAHPVAFGHPQNDPVSLMVGLAAVDDSSHVEALATLAALLGDDERRAALAAASDAAAIKSIVAMYEASLAEDGASSRGGASSG
jgi:PTS system ascorbate-specific IIA component